MEHNYISDYRRIRGIKTIRELAKLADVPETTVGEIERHKMLGNKETLEKIATALKIKIEQLYIPPKQR